MTRSERSGLLSRVTLPVIPFALPPAPPETTRAGKQRIPSTTITQRIAAIRAMRDQYRKEQEC